MTRKTYYLKRLGLIIAATTVSFCSSAPEVKEPQEVQPVTPVKVSPIQEVEDPGPAPDVLASRVDLINQAQIWIDQAYFALTPDKQDLLLRSSGALIKAGELQRAKELLDSVHVSGLPPPYAQRKRLLRAQLALAQGNNDLALRYLSGLKRMQGLSPEFRAAVLSVRAHANLAVNEKGKALSDLVEREVFLVSDEDISRNREQIWALTGLFGSIELQVEREAAGEGSPVADWLDLALLYADFSTDPYRFGQTLADWVSFNPYGSAQRFANEELRMWSRPPDVAAVEVDKVALLLPLASKFGQAAQSVHDGFMAMRALDSNPNEPEIAVFDVGEVPELATSYYELAVSEGADLVIGPLGKQAASALVNSGVIQVPTLLLGGIQPGSTLPPSTFSIDLAPEQEAIGVATRAYLDGNRVAAVLRPDSEWGQRVAEAFIRQWESLGGTVVEAQVYDEQSNDHSFAIKEVLNLSTSLGRKSALNVLLDTELEFEPRRRQDLDLLFLAARPNAGRLIKPQINFFQAHNIPVYATSNIYSGNLDSINDADLNQITFGDMPWILRTDSRTMLLHRSLSDGQHEAGALKRLFALGIDAYLLSRVIPYLQPDQTFDLQGLTADRLVIDRDRQIERQLTWAQFRNGEPFVLDFMDRGEGYENFETERIGIPPGPGSLGGTTGSTVLN